MVRKLTIIGIILAVLWGSAVPAAAKKYGTVTGKNSYFLDMTNVEISQSLIIGRSSNFQADVGKVPISLHYGVLKNMELGMEVPYIFYRSIDDGIGDMVLKQKFKFNEEKKGLPSFSGGVNVGLPTSSFDTGIFASNKLDFELFLIFTKQFSSCTLSGDCGVNFLEGGDDKELAYRLGVHIHINPQLALIAEGSGRSNDWLDEYYFVPGISVATKGGLTLRAGVPLGLSDDSYDYMVQFSIGHIF